ERVERFHADIREANVILQDEGVLDLEDIGALMTDLDNQWPYLHTMCVASGRVYDDEGEPLVLEDERVVSLGVDMKIGEEERKLCHYLGRLEGGEVVATFWVDPDEEGTINIQPLIDNDETRIRALEYHYPEVKADLDETLLNS